MAASSYNPFPGFSTDLHTSLLTASPSLFDSLHDLETTNNLHHLYAASGTSLFPYCPGTLNQATAFHHNLDDTGGCITYGIHQVAQQTGHYLVASHPETTNHLEYINNSSSSSLAGPHAITIPVVMAGFAADSCNSYLPEDDHHQMVADVPQMVDDQYNFLNSTDPPQLFDENWNASDFYFDFTPQNQDIDDSQTVLDGLTASQSSSEPCSAADNGIQKPRFKKWTDGEMSKLLDAINEFRQRPRMWEDILREFFNGSGRTANGLKQKFKDMGKAANSMSASREIYRRASGLAASIRDEKNRNR